jgi:phenylacetate-CoA ligase
MNSTLLRFYHSLPPVARSAVASARGAYLRAWRYDRRTEQLVAEALERETWSIERWKRWQENRLSYVLHRAATRVPYYRHVWEKRRRSGDLASWEYLDNWEVLEKGVVRENPRAFVADDRSPWRMFAEHTSGTTAKPITLWRTRDVQREWYALLEARTRHWYGIDRHDRWAIFGGQLIVPVNHRKPPFWTWNAALNQLYLSAYHLAPDLMPAYLDALKTYRVKSLLGYSSALYFVAQNALRLNRSDLRMEVVVTNAEPVTPLQRRVISEAFQCPVRETYGSAEIVAAGSDCSHGKMHLWPEVGILENLHGEGAVAGELLCTGLLNADMPLIRYRMGDCANLTGTAQNCECGRSLPTIHSIEGRVDDVLQTRDGRRVGRLDPAFKGSMPIHEAQIIQESLDRVRIRYVPAKGFAASSGDAMVRAIHDHLGTVEVILEEVRQIPREQNGKFRAVISKLERKPQIGVSANGHHRAVVERSVSRA